jgi:2-hydroxychromene-2-carboxylate isomerase
MSQIEFYFSTISPYTYLSLPRFRALAEARGLDVTWKPLDIMALYARTGGTPLGERPQSRQDYRLADLARQAKRAGLPIHVQPAHFPTNAAPSSYAIIAAQKAARETGAGDLPGLVEAVLRACWAEQKNIAEDEVITEALAGAGFDPGLAMSGLFTGAEVYGRNLEEAVAAGVFGAPSFVTADGALFWGQDRLDDLADHLDGASDGVG